MQKVGVNSRKGEYFTQIMTLLWLRPQYNRAEIFDINSYRHCKGESGNECGMESSLCMDLGKARGEEGVECE